MAPTQECLDGIACVFSSEEFKKFVEHTGFEPCEGCNGPLPDCATCEGLDCGNCALQLEADAAHMAAWVDGKTAAGTPPTAEEIVAELERYAYCEDTLLIHARKGL